MKSITRISLCFFLVVATASQSAVAQSDASLQFEEFGESDDWGGDQMNLINTMLEPLFEDEIAPGTLVGQIALGSLEVATIHYISPRVGNLLMKPGFAIIRHSGKGVIGKTERVVGRNLIRVVTYYKGLTQTYMVFDVGSRMYVFAVLKENPGFSPAFVIVKGHGFDENGQLKALNYIDSKYSDLVEHSGSEELPVQVVRDFGDSVLERINSHLDPVFADNKAPGALAGQIILNELEWALLYRVVDPGLRGTYRLATDLRYHGFGKQGDEIKSIENRINNIYINSAPLMSLHDHRILTSLKKQRKEMISNFKLGVFGRLESSLGKMARFGLKTASRVGYHYVLVDLGSRIYIYVILDNDPGFSPVYALVKSQSLILSGKVDGAIDQALDYIDQEYEKMREQ